MAVQKGTGFTNLNRIMQANKGNKLAQTVSGGIQGQTQGVQTKVKSAQEQFEEEAQKGRLDTQEAADKRQEMLNRFTPSTGSQGVGQQQPVPGTQQSAPTFQASEGLTALQKQNEAAKQQYTTLQNQVKAQQDTIAKAQSEYAKQSGLVNRMTMSNRIINGGGLYSNDSVKRAQTKLAELQKGLNTAVSGLSSQNQALSAYKNPYEQQYNDMLKSEQDAFAQQQKEAAAKNAPPANPNGIDESQFHVSSGLQQQYDQQKAARQAQLKSEMDQANAQRAKIEDQINRGAQMAATNPNYKTYSESLPILRQMLDTYSGVAASKQKELESGVSDLDKQFQELSGKEKQAWMDSAGDRAFTEHAPTEQEIKDFTKYRTGTYTGPKELQDQASLMGQAQQTEDLGNLARSEGGRQELLRRFVGGQGYTQGQRQLDTTLLGQEPGQLGAAARGTRGSSELVSGAGNQAAGLAQEYVNRAKAFGEETTKQLGDVKTPLSEKLGGKVSEAQAAEDSRLAQLKEIQDALTGTGDQYKGLDKMTRTGLALQQAADKGIINQGDINMLLGTGGKTGLLQRGTDLGLDLNSLLNERFTSQNAQNIARTGVASDVDVARLNALDKLMGKQGTDLEFLEGRGKYQAGKTGLNIGSLEDYINKTEAERGLKDSAYAEKLAQSKPGYLDQALAYAGGALGGANKLTGDVLSDPTKLAGAGVLGAGAGLGMAGVQSALGSAAGAEALGAGAMSGAGVMGPLAAGAMLGVDTLTGKDTTAKSAQAAADTGLAGAGAAAQAQNAILSGLLNLNVAGGSLSNTEAGKQLSKLIAYKSDLENKGLQGLHDVSSDFTGGVGGLTKTGLKDLTSGNIPNLVKNALGATGITSSSRLAKNAVNAVKDTVSRAAGGFGAGKTGNWDPSEYNTIDSGTGKKVKIGSFANKSSDEILKQMMSDRQLNQISTHGNQGNEGAKAASKLMQYYNTALKREQAEKAQEGQFGGVKISDKTFKKDIEYDPKDLQKFMDRLKPAAYDYKDEVKDSPLASKNRELGVMAQDLEKSELGKEAVQDTDIGKVVDYDNLEPKMLASIAALNKRLKELENKK